MERSSMRGLAMAAAAMSLAAVGMEVADESRWTTRGAPVLPAPPPSKPTKRQLRRKRGRSTNSRLVDNPTQEAP